MYTHICNHKKNYMSFYSHNFYVYPHFKVCSYRKTHLSYVYPYFKFITIKRNYVNNIPTLNVFYNEKENTTRNILINYDNLDT